jgi:catechol 2,3-dioxygenase-like lactoylglutathione lyase family enzyme
MDWKLELMQIPVSDDERAKAFYVERAGFVADHDHVVGDDLRFIQLTPPGSACSIAFGRGITDAPVGSARAVLVVSDIHAAHAELVARGVDPGEVQSLEWGSFVSFEDPDGNRWFLQELPARG